MSDNPKCIDISRHQGFPDFAKVKDAGVIACIMKATEGTTYVDPSRIRNFSAAVREGIRCCTYHWLSPGNAKAQMTFYLRTVNPVPGERMIIDYEQDGCTLADLREAVQALIDDPRGLQVTIYSGHLLKQQLGNVYDAFLSENTDLWLAQYTSGEPSWPKGTYRYWTLWQYSDKGSVDGIDGAAVDLDRFNGSDENLLKWISPGETAPQPAPPPDKVPVSIALTVPDNVALKISVNGKLVDGLAG
jgi:lysozyme